jgi:hypothetical protein
VYDPAAPENRHRSVGHERGRTARRRPRDLKRRTWDQGERGPVGAYSGRTSRGKTTPHKDVVPPSHDDVHHERRSRGAGHRRWNTRGAERLGRPRKTAFEAANEHRCEHFSRRGDGG